MVTLVASVFVVGPVFPAVSVTPLAAKRAITVPSEQLATVIVIELPLEADGVKVQPVAVPWLEKSPAAIPETLSEKTSV
jgi:hypothetical protein